MNTETQQQVIAIIKQLGEKLGTTGEHLWSVLIKQASVSAYTNLSCYAATIFLWIILLILVAWKSDDNDHFSSVLVFGAIVMFVAGIMVVPDAIKALLNPEYWALQEVVSMFKK